jgi:hypothetical protein
MVAADPGVVIAGGPRKVGPRKVGALGLDELGRRTTDDLSP